jgi:hypothetical protein
MQTVIARINETWVLAADDLQWILQRRRSNARTWMDMSFVSTTRDILARCMREKGVLQDAADRVLAALPGNFKQWRYGEPAKAAAPTPTTIPAGMAAIHRAMVRAHVTVVEVRL